MSDDTNGIMTFPCEHAIKVMGKSNDNFITTVLDLVSQHAEFCQDKDVKTRHSHHDNYLSITITVTAKNKKQLDDIYQTLTDCDEVLMAL